MNISNNQTELYNIFSKSISSDNPFISDLFDTDTELIDNNKNISEINTNDDSLPYPTPSSLRISTMTAICSINACINLENLSKLIQLQTDGSLPNEKMSISVKKKKKKQINSSRKNNFQNQCTFLVELNNKKTVNQKVFKNGNIQMTGLKSNEDGIEAINILVNNIKKNNTIIDNGLCIENVEEIVISDFNIVLINSDFSCGFKIKREKLYEILGKYGLYVSYEPDIYPGVNAKFYWNSLYNNKDKCGICQCSISCDGKGTGNGNGECKKVTISTFQSGNVIITGARNQEQTNDAYVFINKIFKKHYHEILRISRENKTVDNDYGKIFYINRNNIQNMDTFNKVLNKLSNKKKNKPRLKNSASFSSLETYSKLNTFNKSNCSPIDMIEML